MSIFSLFTNASSNSTNSSSVAMMTDMSREDWKNLAQQFLPNRNDTAAIDVLYNAWIDDRSFSGVSSGLDSSPHITIWNHPMTKTIGWTMVLLLKTIFLERKLDRLSGAYRFLNIGSTLIPFTMAMWTIFIAISEVGEGKAGKEEPVSEIDALVILGEYLITTKGVHHWVLTGFAWSIFRRMTYQKMRSSKILSTIEWMPGILAGMLSLATWIIGETTMVAMLIGGEEDLHPNILLPCAKLMQWGSNTIAGWYFYAWILNLTFGTSRFTSFPWFVLATLAGRFAIFGNV